MSIEKLEEFAKDGDKNLDNLDVSQGFLQSEKPERQWFNDLFNKITKKSNTIIDVINDSGIEGGITGDIITGITSSMVEMNDGRSVEATLIEQFDKSSVFGQTGVRFLAGSSGVDHCGWGSYVEFASGKLSFIYRRAANHAVLNTAAIYCKDSYDGGKTWGNDRVILSSTTNDLRPDPLKLMANNRAGTFINRATTTSGGYFKPLFLKTDDEGVTWTTQEVNAVSPYTFQSTGGLIDYPASVGGHDTMGFIAYGYLSANGLDAFTTVNNGDTWVQVHEVAVNEGEVTGLGEWTGCRLGNTDRWMFTSRSKTASGWNPNMLMWVTDNPLNWGTMRNSGLGLGGNPPAMIYDDETDDVIIFAPSRGGRPVAGFPENTLLEARVDATAAYNANGMIGGLTKYDVIAAFPEWFTSYLAPVKIQGKWTTALTCAEANGTGAAQIMVGDFTSSSGELTKLVNKMNSNNSRFKSIALEQQTELDFPLTIVDKNDATKYLRLRKNRLELRGLDYFEINSNSGLKVNTSIVLGTTSDSIVSANKPRSAVSVDDASSSGYLSSTGSAAARNHNLFLNSNGIVGSITTAGTATSFNTTSDYRVKTVKGDYIDALSKVNSIKIYDAVFNASPTAAPQPMVLAHELQKICPYAVTGAKDAVDEEGNAILQQVDYSKVIPILIAAVQELSKKIELTTP